MSTNHCPDSKQGRQYYDKFEDVPLPVIEGVKYKRSPGHDGWAIGDDGTIKSCLTNTGVHKGIPKFQSEWRDVKPQVQPIQNYLNISTRNKGNGKRGTIYVHKLVLEAFVGPAPEGQECLHRDDNKTNNKLSNLHWGTRKENMEDAVKFGKSPVGERNGQAVLTESIVKESRELRKQGWMYVRIWELMTQKYGIKITQNGFQTAIAGEAWKHIKV